MKFSISIAITRKLLSLILLLNCVWASEYSTSSWANLQISHNALCSMPYGDFRLNIYEHSINQRPTTSPSFKRYFYDPIALLDHNSANIRYNNATEVTEMFFRIEMWNENVQSEVVKYLSDFIDQEIRSNQIQVIPFEKVVLTSTKPSAAYSLSTNWQPYRLEQSLWFSLPCFDPNNCNQLKDNMQQNPTQLNHLKFLFSLSSQPTQSKEIILTTKNILSRKVLSKLWNQCVNTDEYVLITKEEENRLLSDLTTNIIAESFDESEIVSPSSISQIYRILKDLLVISTVTTSEEIDDLGKNVCWKNFKNKTDNKLNLQISGIKDENAQIEEESNMTKESVNKPVSLSIISLAYLRDRYLVDDIRTKVRYSTAVLPTFVRFAQFAKLSIPTDEWVELKKEMKELRSEYHNLKTDNQLLKADYQKLKSEHENLKSAHHSLAREHEVDLQTTNGKLSELRKELEDNTTPDISFHVKRTNSFSNSGTYVPYERVVLNNGNGMNPVTGIFTVPKAGTYLFTFHAQMDPRRDQQVYMQLNGVMKTHIFNEDNTNGNSISQTSAMSIILSLKVNDKIGVYLAAGDLREYSYFSGILVREKK